MTEKDETPCVARTAGRSVVRRASEVLVGLAVLCLCATAATAGELVVEVLDVGQGDAVLVTTADKTVLIDAGPRKRDVLEMLDARGIARIDLAVSTHPHADHIGGMQAVIESKEVGLFVDNGMVHTSGTYERLMTALEAAGVKYRTAGAGQVYKIGGEAKLEVLFPNKSLLSGTRSDLNSNSVVMRLTHGDNCFLLTGDAEEPTEAALVESGIGACNVLKVAHHGGNHSSSTRFLEAVAPEHAIISCGLDNKYGHPGEETLERLGALGVNVLRTDTQGTIRMVSDGRRLVVEAGVEPVGAAVSQVEAAGLGAIDINTASAAALEALPGIGPGKAGKIVAYRESNGPFASIDALSNVSGIGAKTVENIRPHASVGRATGSTAEVVGGGRRELEAGEYGLPASGADSRIDVNVASAVELETLPGIGPSKAQGIIDERTQSGPFASCGDLTRVNGIGPKTVEKLAAMCRTE